MPSACAVFPTAIACSPEVTLASAETPIAIDRVFSASAAAPTAILWVPVESEVVPIAIALSPSD